MKLNIETLKESNEFLNLIINNINAAIFLVDKEMRIYDVNDTFNNVFKKPYNKIIGKRYGNALDCIHAVESNLECGNTPYCHGCDIRNTTINTFKNKKSSTNKKLIQEFKIKGQPLKKIYVYFTRYINFNKKDLVVIIFEDVTETEEQKIKLEKLNEEKNKFIGFAAHDLRSPLSIIQMYSEFILDKMNSNLTKEQLKFIDQIHKTSFSMTILLKDMLDITRIESGVVEINKKLQRYDEFIQKVIALNQIIADKKNIKIIYKSNIKTINLKFDEIRIEQVLNNLLSNAVKFSNPDTIVTIKISKENNKIITEVIDQGLGIPKEEQSKIFHPFHKTSVKPTNGESSTGLGLTIVKKIIDFHNGKIEVKSTVGKGTTFSFYLPVE